MKQWTVKAVAGLAALACTSVVQAEDLSFSARAGLAGGGYRNSSTADFTLLNDNTEVKTSGGNSSYFAYGPQVGVSARFGNIFTDLAVEYLEVRNDDTNPITEKEFELDRTDALLTVGYLIDNRWSVFGGYRRGFQGDGPFDDETFRESGFYVGGGVGGVTAGGFILGASLAYNFSEGKDFPNPGDDIDYNGISLKVSIVPAATPQHALQLRYQRFSGDKDPNLAGFLAVRDLNGDNVIDDNDLEPVVINRTKLVEEYFQLSYTYSFYF